MVQSLAGAGGLTFGRPVCRVDLLRRIKKDIEKICNKMLST